MNWKKQVGIEQEKQRLIGGIAEVQILGERACGGITGDITVNQEKLTVTFAKYVERQENGKWVRSENHHMSFSNSFVWVHTTNLLLRDSNDTVVVVHESLESILKRLRK